MTCPLCNEPLDTAPVVGTHARYGYESRRVCCSRCGLIQVSPQPSEGGLLDYYRDGYRKEYLSSTPITVTKASGERRQYLPTDDDYEEALELTAEFQAAHLDDLHLPDGSMVLEVGCGQGRTLARLAERFHVAGIDPDPEAAEQAQERSGATAYALTWHEAPLTPGSLDAVVSFHVLEHMRDPVAFLRWCRLQLKPGGHLLVEVPNVDTPSGPLNANWWQWVHLFDFSGYTLGAMLRLAGFDDVEVEPHGSALIARGVNRGASLRDYEPHGGPSGEAVATWLHSYEARETAKLSRPAGSDVAARFMAGQVLDADEQELLREEVAALDREAAHIRRSWTDVRHAVSQYAQHAERMGYAGFDVWTADPQVAGQLWGESHAWVRVGALMRYLHECMVRTEQTYGGAK